MKFIKNMKYLLLIFSIFVLSSFIVDSNTTTLFERGYNDSFIVYYNSQCKVCRLKQIPPIPLVYSESIMNNYRLGYITGVQQAIIMLENER